MSHPLSPFETYPRQNNSVKCGCGRRMADGGWRTADGGRRTADDGRRKKIIIEKNDMKNNKLIIEIVGHEKKKIIFLNKNKFLNKFF